MTDHSGKNRYFTKHLFRTGLECPTRLYYKYHDYPENRESRPFIEHFRFNKKQLIKLVRTAYPEGEVISGDSIEEGALETLEKLEGREDAVFDGIVVSGRLMAKLPVMVKKGNRLRVISIQTKVYDPAKHSLTGRDGSIHPKWLNYMVDFAYQLHVIGLARPEWELEPVLVLPNKHGRAASDTLSRLHGEAEPATLQEDREELLVSLDVSEEIRSIFNGTGFDEEHYTADSFRETLRRLVDRYFSGDKFSAEPGEKCRYCEFKVESRRVEEGVKSGFEECWNNHFGEVYAHEGKTPVFDLIGPGTRQWMERDIYLQHRIPDEDVFDVSEILKGDGRLNERQRQSLQVHQSKGRTVPEEIVRPALFNELDRWEYPIHFLDFEAGNYTIPTRRGRKPYHLVIFQYSCHTLLEDGSLEHYEWVDEGDGSYPNYRLAERLHAIPRISEGTIVQYSNFERHALKLIRKGLLNDDGPGEGSRELSRWIRDIIRRNDSSHRQGPYLADMSRMVKDFYYNRSMGDSLSIKDVLQSVLSVSPYLRDIYSEPYHSSNFDGMVWWQPLEEGAESPYRLLEEKQSNRTVRRGTEAMVVYAHMLTGELTESEQQTYREALLSYCELDTLAMLMIYQHWNALGREEGNS